MEIGADAGTRVRATPKNKLNVASQLPTVCLQVIYDGSSGSTDVPDVFATLGMACLFMTSRWEGRGGENTIASITDRKEYGKGHSVNLTQRGLSYSFTSTQRHRVTVMLLPLAVGHTSN